MFLEISHPFAGKEVSRLDYEKIPYNFTLPAPRTILPALILAIGACWRVYAASLTFLNPDELEHLYFSLPSDWLASANEFGHPPFFYWVLHLVLAASTSRWALRALPLLAGTVGPFLVYRWLSILGYSRTGLLAMAILSLSPNLVLLSAQARGYEIAAGLAAWALVLTEGALRNSLASAILLPVVLAAGILTEYSQFSFLAALAVYTLMRGYQVRPGIRFWWLWTAAQVLVLLACWWLYRNVIQAEFARPIFQLRTDTYLALAFPMPGQPPLVFLALGTARLFSYLMSSKFLGVLSMLAFGTGLVLFWIRPAGVAAAKPSNASPSGRAVAAATLTALLLATSAGILRLYPYGQSRHSATLCVLLAAVTAHGIERILRNRPRKAIAAALVVLLAWPRLSSLDPNNIDPKQGDYRATWSAANRLHKLITPGTILLTDQETALILRYAWCGESPILPVAHAEGTSEWILDGVHVLWRRWDLGSARGLEEDAAAVRALYHIDPGTLLLSADGGFHTDAARAVLARDGTGPFLESGGAIYLFRTARAF